MEVSAKSECKTPSDLWWKIEVFPLWKITLKLGSKVIYQRGKTSIFHQKSEGVLHSLFAGTSIRICRYYHQNLLQVIPSDLEGKNSIFFRRSFFPRYALGMPSFNNSVFYTLSICTWFLKRRILFSLSNLRAEYNWRAISRTLPSKGSIPSDFAGNTCRR